MDDDLAGWWFLIVLLNVAPYVEEECIWLEYDDAIEVTFFLRDSFFLNEEKFSDFDDFSKTS